MLSSPDCCHQSQKARYSGGVKSVLDILEAIRALSRGDRHRMAGLLSEELGAELQPTPRDHVWFLESLDRVNRAMQGTSDLEGMMSGVLETALQLALERAQFPALALEACVVWEVEVDLDQADEAQRLMTASARPASRRRAPPAAGKLLVSPQKDRAREPPGPPETLRRTRLDFPSSW